MEVYKIDKDGKYVRPVWIESGEDIPIDCVSFRPSDGIFEAQLNEEGTAFIESLPQVEIEERLNVAPAPDKLDQANKRIAELENMMLMMMDMNL